LKYLPNWQLGIEEMVFFRRAQPDKTLRGQGRMSFLDELRPAGTEWRLTDVRMPAIV
jgi:hypothetical protein